MKYITVDAGTTNTRISLVQNKRITDSMKINVGIRANMNNCGLLKTEIKNESRKF